MCDPNKIFFGDPNNEYNRALRRTYNVNRLLVNGKGRYGVRLDNGAELRPGNINWESIHAGKIRELREKLFADSSVFDELRYRDTRGNAPNHKSESDTFRIVMDESYEQREIAAMAAANKIKQAMMTPGYDDCEFSIAIYQCPKCKRFYLSRRRQGIKISDGAWEVMCDARSLNDGGGHGFVEYYHPSHIEIKLTCVAHIHSHPSHLTTAGTEISCEFSYGDYEQFHRGWMRDYRNIDKYTEYLVTKIGGNWTLTRLELPCGERYKTIVERLNDARYTVEQTRGIYWNNKTEANACQWKQNAKKFRDIVIPFLKTTPIVDNIANTPLTWSNVQELRLWEDTSKKCNEELRRILGRPDWKCKANCDMHVCGERRQTPTCMTVNGTSHTCGERSQRTCRGWDSDERLCNSALGCDRRTQNGCDGRSCNRMVRCDG